MSEPELDVGVDPFDTARQDALLMHTELLELELYKLRRELFGDPGALKINVGAGNQAEQTIAGNQQDPFNGVVIYNPTPATLSVGFQAGSGILAPATVPPFSWAAFPQRYVNLSIATLNGVDAATAIGASVTIFRTRVPPPPGGGQYGSPWRQLTTSTIPNPAAGADWILTVPAGHTWRVNAIRGLLNGSATVANRIPRIRLQDAAGNCFYEIEASQVVTANNSQWYSVAVGDHNTQAGNTARQTIGIPDMWLPPGFQVLAGTGGIQAGDQWNNLVYAIQDQAFLG